MLKLSFCSSSFYLSGWYMYSKVGSMVMEDYIEAALLTYMEFNTATSLDLDPLYPCSSRMVYLTNGLFNKCLSHLDSLTWP
jgi:hypothetical protein